MTDENELPEEELTETEQEADIAIRDGEIVGRDGQPTDNLAGGSSSGGSSGGSRSRTAEDFDPDNYPGARTVSELGEIRRENYGFTEQEQRRMDRGEDPVGSSDGQSFVSFQPSFEREDSDEGRVLGRGDTAEEATADTQLRTGDITTGFTGRTDQTEVFREQQSQLQDSRDRLQETIDEVPEADTLNLRNTGLEDELGRTASREEVVGFLQEQDRQLEQGISEIDSVSAEFERQERRQAEEVNRFDARTQDVSQGFVNQREIDANIRTQPELDPFNIQDTDQGITAPGETGMITGTEQPQGTSIDGTNFFDQRQQIGQERNIIGGFASGLNPFGTEPEPPLTETGENVDVNLGEAGLGTRALAGGAAAFNPEISSQVLGRSAQDLTPFELPFDTEGSTQQLVEEDIERQIREDESITDNISPFSEGGMALAAGPLGRAAGGTIQGARAIGSRTGAAATGVLGASGIGLTAAEVGQIRDAQREGRGDEALGRTIGLSAGLAGTTAGAARGLRQFSPQLGRTAEIDSTATGTPAGDQRIIGSGDAEGTVNVLRNRLLLPGRSQRQADVEGDFRFDADEAGTISEGEFAIEGPDGFQDTGFDFETISTPLTTQGDSTVSRDLGRTETEGLLFRRSDDFDGVSRSTRVEDETLDSAQFVSDEAFLDTGQPVRRVETDNIARLQDGSETFGTQELFLPATRTGGQGRDIGLGTGTSAAGGARGATDVDLSGVQQGFVQNIRQVNQDLARPGLGESGIGAASGAGLSSTGAQAETRPVQDQEVQEFEAEIDRVQTQQEPTTQEMGIQGSPLIDTGELTRGTVTDRLTREAEIEETEGIGQRQGSTLQREPSPEHARPQTETRPVTDIGPAITRGTTFDTTPSLASPFGALSTDTSQDQGLERPLADDALGVTRRELPDTRIRQEEGLIPGLALGTSTTQQQRTQQRSTGLGTPFTPSTGFAMGAGLGLGLESEASSLDADPFLGGETEEEFAPDFGTSIGLFEEEDAATEEDDLTGLERRGNGGLGDPGLF